MACVVFHPMAVQIAGSFAQLGVLLYIANNGLISCLSIWGVLKVLSVIRAGGGKGCAHSQTHTHTHTHTHGVGGHSNILHTYTHPKSLHTRTQKVYMHAPKRSTYTHPHPKSLRVTCTELLAVVAMYSHPTGGYSRLAQERSWLRLHLKGSAFKPAHIGVLFVSLLRL